MEMANMKKENIIEINFDKERVMDKFKKDKKQFIIPLCALGLSAMGATMLVTASVLHFLQ